MEEDPNLVASVTAEDVFAGQEHGTESAQVGFTFRRLLGHTGLAPAPAIPSRCSMLIEKLAKRQ